MKIVIPAFIFFVSASVFSASASADVIYLKNGDRISGVITAIYDSTVFVDPSYSEEIRIGFTDIANLQTDQQMELQLEDGRQGTFRIEGMNASGLVELASTDNAIVVDYTSFIDLDDIQEAEDLQEGTDWESRLEVNNSFEKGNTDIFKVNFKGLLAWEFAESRARFNTDVMQERIDDRKTQDRSRNEFSYDWELVDPWYINANATYETDEIALLDYRATVGGSLGYDFFDSEHRHLSVQLGPGFQKENLAGQKNNNQLIDWRLRFDYDFLGDQLELYHDHRIYKNFSGRRNTVLNSSSGLRYRLTDEIYINTEVKYEFNSSPAPGRVAERFIYLTGVGLNFD